ncbi:MAG: hypothetical protein LBU79_03985 [Planctomycetota bacterium]|jgi:hypothetical protein|nr:hypothetical protein [Planctomycetota bacterium]
MPLDKLDPANNRVNTDNLFRQETYTDLGMGTIQCLTPVKIDGSPDSSRAAIFMGSAQIMTQAGMIPVQCEIPATSLKTACEAFPEAIRGAVNELIEQARQLERERHGGIVIPRGGNIELP